MILFIVGVSILIISLLIIKFFKEDIEGNLFAKRLLLLALALGVSFWASGLVSVFTR